jgi:hypothetical protein
MTTQQGFIVLKSPPGMTFSDVWLQNGRRVRPDEHGCIHVGPGETNALLAVGWTVVPPAPQAA